MILYPDEFPVDNFLRSFRDESGDCESRIKSVANLLSAEGLAASIWESKIELYDTPLEQLNFPDGIKRLIIKFTKPKEETAHDLLCTWCSDQYLSIFCLPEEYVIGTRAYASEMMLNNRYRSLPRQLLPLEELSKLERDLYECSNCLGINVNKSLPHCLQLKNLPQDIATIPVFHGLKIDGHGDLFAIRCAIFIIDEDRFLVINDRTAGAEELMQAVFDSKDDPGALERYILYLEVDLLPDDFDFDEFCLTDGTDGEISSFNEEGDSFLYDTEAEED